MMCAPPTPSGTWWLPGVPGMEAEQSDRSGYVRRYPGGRQGPDQGVGRTDWQALETAVSNRIQENIRKTLTPYLGLENFQVSVAAELNTDRKTIAETIFDPGFPHRALRAAPSVRMKTPRTPVRELRRRRWSRTCRKKMFLQRMANDRAEENERREETVNYEISSKRIETSQDGYKVDRLSIAVLVDKSATCAVARRRADSQAQIQEQLTGNRSTGCVFRWR